MPKTALFIEGDRQLRECFGRLSQRGLEERILFAENETEALKMLEADPDIYYLISGGHTRETAEAVLFKYPRLQIVELTPEESKMKGMLSMELVHISDCLSALLNSLLLRLQTFY
ncbi:hypothetical protein HZC35_02570 [Candidatus Saganbacteria bacterium]|nr:hypothetical protein [Candidatus Saganbacteria bacterium]